MHCLLLFSFCQYRRRYDAAATAAAAAADDDDDDDDDVKASCTNLANII